VADPSKTHPDLESRQRSFSGAGRGRDRPESGSMDLVAADAGKDLSEYNTCAGIGSAARGTIRRAIAAAARA